VDYIGITLSITLSVRLSKCLVIAMVELILMKLNTVPVYTLRIHIKEDCLWVQYLAQVC